LNEALAWGTLPKILHLKSNDEKKEFLRAYALIYLKEEIVAEQATGLIQEILFW